jgi:hypothetical protein
VNVNARSRLSMMGQNALRTLKEQRLHALGFEPLVQRAQDAAFSDAGFIRQ